MNQFDFYRLTKSEYEDVKKICKREGIQKIIYDHSMIEHLMNLNENKLILGKVCSTKTKFKQYQNYVLHLKPIKGSDWAGIICLERRNND